MNLILDMARAGPSEREVLKFNGIFTNDKSQILYTADWQSCATWIW